MESQVHFGSPDIRNLHRPERAAQRTLEIHEPNSLGLLIDSLGLHVQVTRSIYITENKLEPKPRDVDRKNATCVKQHESRRCHKLITDSHCCREDGHCNPLRFRICMRLKGFGLRDIGPLSQVLVDDLADVVVLAGPNGVGKTSINNALLDLAREPRVVQNRWMIVEATDDAERTGWGTNQLDTRIVGDSQKLTNHLRRNQRRNRYYSSFLNFDSDRAVRNVQSFNFTWDIKNPLSEEVGWDLGLSQLSNRYNDVRHSLFRLVESQRREIADRAIENRDSGMREMSLDFPDLLQPFKDAFWQLLAPKRLVDVSVRDQEIYYEHNGRRLPLASLSSGEREVVNVVFDFLLRGPQHSIIVFDEPELHLHPELSYKLLQTLRSIGKRNQFIFSSHSPEIISASLENTVVFVAPPTEPNANQAIVVHRDDETHEALRTLGQSIGVISLGKKIVLVEGDESSLDKQTYGAILKSRFPEFVLVPAGGKDTLRSFQLVHDNILNRTIWGVEFFLLADRDAVYALGKSALRTSASQRARELPRYHLENYFLSSGALSRAFEALERPGSWLLDETQIEQRLTILARSVIPYAVALNVNASVRHTLGNVSIMPRSISGSQTAEVLLEMMSERIDTETARLREGLAKETVAGMIRDEFERLSHSVDAGTWRAELPGRTIFNQFASAASVQPGRLKQMYLSACTETDEFAEIVQIFEDFRAAAPAGAVAKP